MENGKQAWRCTVCGYIHYGDSPPDNCPVCGATKDLFEKYSKAEEKSGPQEDVQEWQCINCEHIHLGDTPPKFCSLCGSSENNFEAYLPLAAIKPLGDSKTLHLLIIGGGIAGVSAAEAARQKDKNIKITIMSKDKHYPYYRLNLTRYLAGEIKEEELLLHSEKWYEQENISFLLNRELCTLNRLERKAFLCDGEVIHYDKLIIAMGSHPFIPPFPGSNRENVLSLRTKENADYILKHCNKPISVVIIGGGILGLETAGALSQKGMKVTLVEGFGWLLPRQLNERAARMLEDFVQGLGIKIEMNVRVKEILGDESVKSVLLDDGKSINSDIVIITAGVRSNSYVARMSGLEVNQGIIVNNYLQSSDLNIFAAGDVAEHHGMTYGTWGPSQFQGTIAGMNASGEFNEFAGIPRSNLLKVLGYDLFSIGQIHGDDASFKRLEFSENPAYFCFYFRDNHMVGAILMAQTGLSSYVKKIIENHIDCNEVFQKDMTFKTFSSWLVQ